MNDALGHHATPPKGMKPGPEHIHPGLGPHAIPLGQVPLFNSIDQAGVLQLVNTTIVFMEPRREECSLVRGSLIGHDGRASAQTALLLAKSQFTHGAPPRSLAVCHHATQARGMKPGPEL
jgi:hypothetical protein